MPGMKESVGTGRPFDKMEEGWPSALAPQSSTADDLLRELIGEVRALRTEISRARWLPEEWARWAEANLKRDQN